MTGNKMTLPRIVMKFGGTSLGDPDAVARTMDHVIREQRDPLVIVSAVGGVTDLLTIAIEESAIVVIISFGIQDFFTQRKDSITRRMPKLVSPRILITPVWRILLHGQRQKIMERCREINWRA